MTSCHRFGALAIFALLLVVPCSHAAAQAGVPGGRLGTGRDHLAAARAEAYISAVTFLDRWKSAWEARDADALARLYTDDAAVRFPGRAVVRTRDPLARELNEALELAAPITASDVDFHTSAETAVLVACYFTELDGRPVSGLVTTVLQPSGRSWRIRIQMFDPPQPAGAGQQRFGC